MRTTILLLFAVILLLACPAEAQDDNLLGSLIRALLDLLCSLPLIDLFCNAGGGCGGYRPWWTLVQEVCDADTEFCEHPVDTCLIADLPGTCVPIPDFCTLNYDPVCGCDGTTYDNDCVRQAARVSKASDGACTTGSNCGGIAGTICSQEDEFCDYDAGSCEFADASGECVPIPENCIEIYDPVCGCNGVTYGNDCERQVARVMKESNGACPEPCGGIAGILCTVTDAFCENEEGTCETADALGVCVSVPDGCPEILDPVCGCDGNTYGNDCERQAARVSKAGDGGCPEPCGGIAGISCTETDAFCENYAGTCETADAFGVCVQISDFCPLNIDPVCGCDGITYNNDCLRQAARVSKAKDGEC